jgi:hypothetical protein
MPAAPGCRGLAGDRLLLLVFLDLIAIDSPV